MFFRVKSTGPYRYLQIAHSVREGGKVRQQVIATLGRVDILQASGQFDSLIRSGARFCEKVTVLDAHAAGETRPVRIASIGPDLVFARLWEQTGIGPAVREQAAGRRFGFEVERAIYLTVLHRLFATGSDRAAERWREDYQIPGTEALALQHPSLVGVCLSGSGPSILALATGDFDEVAGLFRDLYTRLQVSCEVRAVAAHQPGAVS